jgi:hypothetical protein
MTSEENYNRFRTVLAKHYTVLYATDPEYAYAKAKRTPEDLADRMSANLLTGSANKDGEGIKRTCKELGIKQTYKAIREYFDGDKQ